MYNSSIKTHQKIAEILCEKWKKNLNISISLNQVEEKVFKEKAYSHNFDLTLFYWVVQYNDPMNILERFTYRNHPKNYSAWENTNYIKTVEAITKEKDNLLRKKKIEEAEIILSEELPLTPIYHMNYTMLIHPYISQIVIGPVGDIYIERTKFKK